MLNKSFKLITNAPNIKSYISKDLFTLSIENMPIYDLLESNFSLEELYTYLKKYDKLEDIPVDIYNKKRNFKISVDSSGIKTYIYPSGKFSITIPEANRWTILRNYLSPEEIAGHINERTTSLQAAVFFNLKEKSC